MSNPRNKPKSDAEWYDLSWIAARVVFLTPNGDLGVHEASELTYDSVIRLIKTKMYCSEDTKGVILNNVARMIDFLAHKGLCSTNFKYLFNVQLFPHISMISEFSTKNKTLLKNIGSFILNADEVYNSITSFSENLKSNGYVGTTLKLVNHALTALYVFLDMHHLGFHPDIMWIWFSEIKGQMGHSWLHWRRVLKFYEEYIQSGDITEPPKLRDENGNIDTASLGHLVPWSETLPYNCRKPRRK